MYGGSEYENIYVIILQLVEKQTVSEPFVHL